MKKIPKCFQKYLKDAEIRDINFLMSNTTAFNIILKKILESKDGKLILKETNGDRPIFYQIDEKHDISKAFLSKTWENCTFEDKVKCIHLFIEKFFKNTDCPTPILTGIPYKKEILNQNILGYYQKENNEIFINFDSMTHMTGIQCYSIIYHECCHALNFYDIKYKLIPDILFKYCGIVSNEYDLDIDKMCAIMELPTQDCIYNYKTGKIVNMTHIIRNDILQAKNYIIAFLPEPTKSLEEIKSKKELSNYLDNSFYLASPCERFARTETLKRLREISVGYKHTYTDSIILKKLINHEKEVTTKLKADREFTFKYKGLFPVNPIAYLDLWDSFAKEKFYEQQKKKISGLPKRYTALYTRALEITKKIKDTIYSHLDDDIEMEI